MENLNDKYIDKISISKFEIIAVDNPQAAIKQAIKLAREGDVKLIVRGGVKSEDLLHEIQKHDKGLGSYRIKLFAVV